MGAGSTRFCSNCCGGEAVTKQISVVVKARSLAPKVLQREQEGLKYYFRWLKASGSTRRICYCQSQHNKLVNNYITHKGTQATPDLLESTGKRLGFLCTLREPLEHKSRARSIQKLSRQHSELHI